MTRYSALLLSIVSLPLFVACGGTTLAEPGGDAGSNDGSAPPTGDDATPAPSGDDASPLPTDNDSGLPGNPGGPTPPSSTPDLTLAVRTLYLGDSDRNGGRARRHGRGSG